MTDDTALPDFGEPLDKDELLELGTIEIVSQPSSIDSAIDWWDENATVRFMGILEQ